MKMSPNWMDPKVVERNKESVHSITIPFINESSALEGDSSVSPRAQWVLEALHVDQILSQNIESNQSLLILSSG